MPNYIEGAYDLHVHSAPDVLPRLMDDVDMIDRIKNSGMAGYVIKSHYFCTAERAAIINKLQSDCRAIGSITLNASVGGINPTAVEMAGRAGTKLVWFPTCDNEAERAHTFNGDPNKKLPYWGRIILQMKEEGIEAPTINILRDGKLIPEVYDVIEIIKKYNMILATSHLSHAEAFAIVKAASEKGVERIVITHWDFPTTYYTVEEQKIFASYGAYLEHCFTTWYTGKVDLEDSLAQIRALGADRCFIATDLGGKNNNVYPDEGMQMYGEKLFEAGFTREEIKKMMVTNPAYLVS